MMRTRAVVAAVILSAGTSALIAAPDANAVPAYAHLGAFAERAPDADTAHLRRIAVDRASDRLYVTDLVSDEVRVFDATDTGVTEQAPFGGGTLTDPTGIAVDQTTGAVFVADTSGVHKYDRTLTPDASFRGVTVTGPLAFDQTSGELVVADATDNLVKRFRADGTASGTLDGTGSADGTFTGLTDVAVDSSGDTIVVDSTGDVGAGLGTSRVERFAADGSSEGPVGAVPAAAVVAVGADDEVYVSGNQSSALTSQSLTVDVFGSDGTSQQTMTLPGEPFAPGSTLYGTVTGIAVAGGGRARAYVATDVSGPPFAGVYGSSTVQIYERPVPARPGVTTGQPQYVSADTIRFAGTVDPNLLGTTYWVEYGRDASYGNRFPVGRDAELDAGADPLPVRLQVGGFEPATTYHYRIVARNALGTSSGDDRVVATAATAPPAQPYRYELVSPIDKNGGDIQGPSGYGTVRSTPSGDAVVYNAQNAFAQPDAGLVVNRYLSRRGTDGWATAAVDPPQLPYPRQFGQASFAASEDLSRQFVVSRAALAAGATAGDSNLYVRSGSSYQLVVSSPDPLLFDEFAAPGNTSFAGATADLGHLLFTSTAALTPDAVGGISNLYDFSAGQLTLVNTLPDGSVDPVTGGVLGSLDARAHALSADGSRIAFLRGPVDFGPLYLRVGGSETIPVSASQRTGDPPGVAHDAYFGGADADVSTVYFVSPAALTDDSTYTNVGLGELYRYDVDSRQLTDLTVATDPADVDGAEVTGVLGVSDSGDRVYFAAHAKLAAGATSGEGNLYVTEGGTTRFVATLDESRDLALTRGNPALRSNSPDGRYLAFVSASGLTSDATADNAEVYLYDAVAERLSCASCSPIGDPPRGAAAINRTAGGHHGNLGSYYPRAVDDGGLVFFDTPTALVSEDTNGTTDAYVLRDGRPALISSGRSDTPSFFAEASSDGSTVFIKTRERLVGRDVDDKFDLYAARVGGGFAEPTAQLPITCEGDACQGAAAGPGTPSAPASATTGEEPAKAVPRTPVTVTSLSPRQLRRLAAGGSVSLRVRVTRAGVVRATGRARVNGRRAVVVRAVSRARGAGAVELSLRLSAAARNWLKARHPLTITLGVTAAGATRVATLRLRPPRASGTGARKRAATFPAGHDREAR